MQENIQYDINLDKNYSNIGLLNGLIKYTEFIGQDIYLDDEDGLTPTKLDSGLFTRNVDGWNIRAACEWLASHGTGREKHVCARYVRSAIDIGFGTNPNTNSYTAIHGHHTYGNRQVKGRPNWAWRYISYLPTIGFKYIGKVSRSGQGNFNAQPGDIACYQNGGNPNVPGHICMYTGVAWTSDFTQRNMIVYAKTNEAYIFRFE